MTVISYRDGVAIGEIVFYVPILIIGILLAIRHGFGRSSGWVFLIIFSLIRIIGAGFQLATISNPNSVSVYTGIAILQNIGISPLELTALGLLSRVISSINRAQSTFVRPNHLRLIQILVIVGLILGIVGGSQASSNLSKTGVYQPQTLSKVGVILFIVSYVGLVLATCFTSFSISYAESGEKRLLLAVALAVPFLLVRLVYSAISTFASSSSFNSITGNVTIFLCMALIMEAIMCIIFEGVGLTLTRSGRQQPPLQQADLPGGHPRQTLRPYDASAPSEGPKVYGAQAGQMPGGRTDQRGYNEVPRSSRGNQVLSTLGRRTIIGRLVTRVMGNGDNDIEMQRRY